MVISQGTLYTWFLVPRRALLASYTCFSYFSLKTELWYDTSLACTPPLTLWHVRLLFLSLHDTLLHHAVFLDFRFFDLLESILILSPQCLGNIWYTGDAPSVLTNWMTGFKFRKKQVYGKNDYFENKSDLCLSSEQSVLYLQRAHINPHIIKIKDI